MKNLTRGLVVFAALMVSGAAFAQQSGCTTVQGNLARTCGLPGGGQITAVSDGTVTVIRNGKVLNLAAGAAVLPGDRLIVRGANTAMVALGNACVITVTSRAAATLTSSGGSLCLTQNAAPPAPAAQLPPPATGLSNPALLGGAVVGAGAIAGALLLNQGDDRKTISQPAVNPIR